MWVKICGIRDVAAAQAAARSGADAIGLNFYAPSPRAVTVDQARAIARELPPGIEAVGLFVNHSVDEIAAVVAECDLRLIQLHGDESPQRMAEIRERIPGLGMIRAFRVGEAGLGPVARDLARCRELGVALTACLLDSYSSGSYGGTGQCAPWEIVAREYRREEWPPLILAGGLTCENVAEAIAAVRPWGVDTASGVESRPGYKDLTLIERFANNARAAFSKLAG